METITETAPTFVASLDIEKENAVCSTDKTNILGIDESVKIPKFIPKRLSDLRSLEFQEELISFVKKNPEIDFVYRFDLPEYDSTDKDSWCMQGQKCLLALPHDTGKGIFIGGSSALHYIQCYIKGNNNVNWKSTDIDVFFLNCTENTRMEGAPGSLDFVFCKDKTVESVLLNFDLPCCRVGFDFKYNFFVSAQALVAIFTGKMFLPEYFSNENDFMEKLNKCRLFQSSKNISESTIRAINRMIVRRFYERVKKYQSRGFKTIYTHLDYILPWVKNRFTYVDFDI